MTPTGRTPIVAGNWKMNTTVKEGRDLAIAIRDQIADVHGVLTVLCPPFVSLASVADAVAGSTIRVGAQNMHFQPSGAFTGEVAAPMLVGICDFVVLGHSERRQYFRESSAFVNQKVTAALMHGLFPIVCVGETLEQREAGRTDQVLGRQVRGSLAGVTDFSRVAIAYEPIWAIGTGRAATPQDATDGIGDIRRTVASMAGVEVAHSIRILYGGSVGPNNAATLFAQPEIDGGLIGGASLKADQFAAVVRAAATSQ
ncbi:MAG: triose-phosphate isomerase [Chloroflexi bacterium]|nr:triose-phosphate isomerase [Chloroflexota bacterium]